MGRGPFRREAGIRTFALTALLVSLAPAWRLAQADVNEGLKEGGQAQCELFDLSDDDATAAACTRLLAAGPVPSGAGVSLK